MRETHFLKFSSLNGVARVPSDHRVSGAQVRDLTAGIAQQQQTAMEAMLNNERSSPAAQAQGINEKYYKRVESFTGEQAWRDWSFQFKSATKTANEAAYHLIETAEKEEKEIDDALSLFEEERSLSSGIFNIQIQWIRSVEKALQEVQPHDANEGINPGKAKGLEQVAIHIDRWEAKVLALSRDFNELLSEKMRAAILISTLAGRQDRGLQENQRQSRDHRGGKARTQEPWCHGVR